MILRQEHPVRKSTRSAGDISGTLRFFTWSLKVDENSYPVLQIAYEELLCHTSGI